MNVCEKTPHNPCVGLDQIVQTFLLLPVKQGQAYLLALESKASNRAPVYCSVPPEWS